METGVLIKLKLSFSSKDRAVTFGVNEALVFGTVRRPCVTDVTNKCVQPLR